MTRLKWTSYKIIQKIPPVSTEMLKFLTDGIFPGASTWCRISI
jgi:hypothetical protein